MSISRCRMLEISIILIKYQIRICWQMKTNEIYESQLNEGDIYNTIILRILVHTY